MKCLNFWLIAFFIVISSSLFAQTPQQIEADLLKSFKRIDYWKVKESTDTTMAWSDSLFKANDIFAKKLKRYAEKFPATIAYPFNILKKNYVDISTSTDAKLRIYSWDTETGGTMHFFESVMQYRSGTGCKVILDTPKSEGDAEPNYYKMYTFKNGIKAYYLVVYLGIESSADSYHGIQIFSIDNEKLNRDTKIIKTQSGLRSEISYEAHSNSSDDPRIYFDSATQTIHIPIVTEEGRVTKNYIIYKFTGQYFEQVKN